MSVSNIKKVTVKNCIVDELHIRRSVDSSVDLTSTKTPWQIDTYLLAQFKNSLEAGNISNSGVQIQQFAIRRRRVGDLNSTLLGRLDYDPNQSIEYTDYTAGNDDYIYTIAPIGVNGLEGVGSDTTITSEFVGWWLVDKDTNTVLPFDKFTDSEPTVDVQLNQGRAEIQTFYKYPSVYYNGVSYNSFSLTATLIPSEFERVGQTFESVIDTFVNQHKTVLVKSGDGRLFCCDCHDARFNTPLNLWKQRDYGSMTLSFTEVMNYEDYMEG